jgi:hypothetical protein
MRKIIKVKLTFHKTSIWNDEQESIIFLRPSQVERYYKYKILNLHERELVTQKKASGNI